MEQKHILPAHYAVLGIRLTLGIMLLLVGVGKILSGLGNFADAIAGMLAQIGFFTAAAWPLALFFVLAEILIGAALVLGMSVSGAFFLSILLMGFINVGLILLGDMAHAKTNMIIIGLAAIGLIAQSVGARVAMPNRSPEYVFVEEPKKKTTRRKAKRKTA